jgi:predicted N-acetyltransferase YhbS
MHNEFNIRRANSEQDAEKLKGFFNEVFHPEDVGGFAKIIFEYFPGMEKRYWFIIEDEVADQIIAAFALIPWEWEFEGIKLKVAEMGIVGTQADYHGRGLQRILNKEFDQTLEEEGFDFAIIQGIPGFYGQFGYFYSIPLENHINLYFHMIPTCDASYSFRLAEPDDIPFLMEEDESYQARYSFSALRSEAKWNYMLTESLKTEYGSEFWIMESKESGEKFYCRIPAEGFGEGLIVSEISEGISPPALEALFVFFKEKAQKRDKPYIRLNLHYESTAGRMALKLGAKEGRPYAWQIKIPDTIRFLKSIAQVLEKRIKASSFNAYTGTFRLDFYKKSVDMIWENGRLKSVREGDGESDGSFNISAHLFPALALGHRNWQELRHIHPDIFIGSAESALFIETLFPKALSWIHEQY